MRTFKSLRVGDVFTLPRSGDDTTYVKLGNHGAREVDGHTIDHDAHYIPALYERCSFQYNLSD